MEAICRKNDLLVFYDEIHSEIADVEPHGHNPILANTIKRIGLAERTGREINQIYEGSLLYGWRLSDYLQSTDSSVRPFMLRGLPDKAFVRMISEDIGHSAARLCPRGLPAPTSPVGRGKARPAW